MENLIKLQYPQWLGKLMFLPEIPSTNQFLLDKIKTEAKLPLGSVVMADSQTAGRGQRGRPWISPPGYNLYLSLYWQFPKHCSLQGLSLSIGILVAQFLEELGASEIALKWPNDIIFDGKKLGGILIENAYSQKQQKVVIGLGLNVCLPSEHRALIDQPCVDLRTIFTNIPDRVTLAIDLIAQLLKGLEDFSVSGFSNFEASWQKFDYLANKKVFLQKNALESITGWVLGISPEGALRIQTEHNHVEEIWEHSSPIRLAALSA